jgi:anthranilate synthase component II
MKIIIIDNYDSFTYNLVHLIESISNADVTVVRNDEVDFNSIALFDKIVLSPGPGVPTEAGKLIEIIQQFYNVKPILGVCLGHQAITQALGGSIINLSKVFHGVSTTCNVVDNKALLFKNLPKQIEIGRYHSWVANKDDFPSDLQITAIDEEEQIMAFQHKHLNVHGVQFHPESILTPDGKMIMKNFLEA